MAETYRVGLLGHGTVGAAFAELLAERADAIAPITGLRPEISGVLTRSRGTFDEILRELGPDRRADRAASSRRATTCCAAMRAGKHVVSANKLLLSQHGEELWACAREHGVQLRFEGAVAGVVPVIRVLQESLAAAHVERIHGIVNGTTNFILTEMARGGLSYDEALRQAQELGYAEADPTDDVTGRDAAAKMAILARLAFSTPVHLDQVVYEGIEHLTAGRHGVRARPRARAEADRHRRARRRRHQRARAPGVPVRRPPAGVRPRPVQRRHGRVGRDHRGHAVAARARAARRPRARCSAT